MAVGTFGALILPFRSDPPAVPIPSAFERFELIYQEKTMFQKGKSGNPQGKNRDGEKSVVKNGSSWFRASCIREAKRRKLAEFWGKVAAGEKIEDKLLWKKNASGKSELVTEKVAPSMYDRREASSLLASYAFGRPAQSVAVQDDDMPNLSKLAALVSGARVERGLSE